LASIRNVICFEPGSAGSHRETVSLRLTFLRSTSSSSNVLSYVNATAPLRKCIAVVAGCPVID
jgi:hypothetical protein